MVKIKICGLFREEDITYANEAGPDYIGFVFAQKSKRFVSPAQAAGLRKKLRKDIIPVGVFVNADIGEIVNIYREGTIGMVQLHGGESDEYIAELRAQCDAPLIRALDVEKLQSGGFAALAVKPQADYVLLDSGSGGTGENFDWALLDTAKSSLSGSGLPLFFLAGGIGLHNIDAALAYNPYAVDVSSGAESGAVKDRGKMIRLVEKVHGC
jgi:phosphoribosylanthranilate isomerase